MYKLNRRKSNYRQLIIILICLIPILLYIFLPSRKENTILILGNSLSSPYGIGPKDSWVTLLQERLDKEKYPYKVINSSIPGDMTTGGLKRLPRNLKDYKPVLTIIELGANDAIQGLPLVTIKNNLITLITLAKNAHSEVLLLGLRMYPNNTIQYMDHFHMIYTDLAKSEHVSLVPYFLKGVDINKDLMQEDKLHPVKDAQAQLLETVWPEIVKILNRVKKKQLDSRSTE